ncbi:MAG TPA: DNA-processing protein DprA [Longimicrobiales bacterium]|nr:DNA-processing protein DprA [Longimicrobiales bacterium]
MTRDVVRIDSSHPSFPARLHHLPDPPDVLYYRGDLRALEAPCVTIVGSRRSTEYGRRVAGEIARAAARAGWTVVSGLALGVDGAAHRGALEAGGASVAVLGAGPDRAHPRAHGPLMEALLARGAVVSEYPPGVSPRKHHFPRRNRILAALALRVVVVEAAQRSGALITAGIAAELGTEVWAVPASIYSPTARGPHALLEDGAIPVASMDAWEASLRIQRAGGGGGQLTLGPQGDVLQRRVWEALREEPVPLEELSRGLAVPVTALLPALTALELQGWVTRGPGPVFTRRAA